MTMLNLNCIQSVREGLERTREELRLQLRGIWHVPGSSAFSAVPENKRQSYREVLQEQERHLQERLAELGAKIQQDLDRAESQWPEGQPEWAKRQLRESLQKRLRIAQQEVYSRKYDDSARGAFQMLMAIADVGFEFEDGLYRADPHVDGVWEATFPNAQFIAYLAGYPDCMGQIREINDFESDHGSHGTCWTTNGQKGE